MDEREEWEERPDETHAEWYARTHCDPDHVFPFTGKGCLISIGVSLAFWAAVILCIWRIG